MPNFFFNIKKKKKNHGYEPTPKLVHIYWFLIIYPPGLNVVQRLTGAIVIMEIRCVCLKNGGKVIYNAHVSGWIVVEFTIYGFCYRFTRLHSSSRTPTAFWICLLISMLYWLLSRSIQGSWKPSSVLNEQVFLPLILSIGNILVFHFYSSYSPKKMPAPSCQIKGTIRPFFFFFNQ